MNKSRRKLVLILFITFIFLNIFITLRNNNLNNPNDTKNNEFSSFRLKNSAYNFTGTIVLTNNSTDNSEYPSMVIDNLGNIHIAWQESNESDSGDTDIFYKKWNSTTEEWSLPEIVSNISTSYGRYPVITIDNTYNIHIAWIDRTNYNGCGSDNDVFYSKKNSATEEWTLTEVITTYSDNETADASIAVDNSGNVHIAFREWMNYLSSGFDRDLYYVQWNNNTETWIPIELVSSESDDHSYGPSLAIDASGDLNIVWYDFADYDNSGNDLDIFYKQRNNISGIWTSTDVVSTQSGAYSKNPKIIIDNSDKMHIAWSDRSNYTGSGTEYDIFYKQWNKTLGDWTTTEVISTVSNGTSDSNNPSMIVDNFENICIVWSDSIDYNDSGNDDDILYRNWNSTIGNWTETRVVSTESDSNSIFPQLAIDNFGSMHIAWQDSSNISSSDFDYDIVYKKLIVHNRPSVNDPTDIITTNTGSETIDWIITDDVGEGMYRVIIDNTIVEIDWTPWNNNTIINIPIDRTAPGSFLYTIEYYDLYDIYGINNTITITIEDAFPTINHPNNPNIEKDYLHTIEWTIVDDFGGGNYRIFVNDIPGNWQPWTSNIPIEYTVDSTIIGDFNVTIQYQTTTGQIDYDTVMVDIIPSGAEVFMDLLPYILIIVGVILGISSYLIIKNHNKSKKVAVWKEKAHVFSDLLNIDLILIIHKETSSTIVQHNFSEQTLDGDLISGFLEAMTSFKYELKKNSYKKRSMETTLLDYDQYKVLIKDGLFIRVAMILDKEPSNYLQDSIVEFINEFEARYSDILKNFIGRITQFQTSIDLINKYFNVSLIYPHCINRKHLSIEMTSFQKEIMKLAQQLESTKGQFYISELINYIASEKSDELKEKIIANIIDLRQSGLIKLSNF